MSKKLNITDKLDFSEIDLTPPNKVIEEILAELPDDTQGIISGTITEYSGHVVSYTTTHSSLAEVLGTVTAEKRVDIQNSLGKQGEENKKYECFLYTVGYTKYKYRMFFMQYGIANYPVRFILEESIAQSIQGTGLSYILTCNKREEVEELILKILTSKKVLGVMQELIRIYQTKKMDGSTKVINDGIDKE